MRWPTSEPAILARARQSLNSIDRRHEPSRAGGDRPTPTALEPPASVLLRHPALQRLRRAAHRVDHAADDAFDVFRGRPAFDRAFYVASELGNFSLIWHTLAAARGVRRGGDLAGTVRLSTALGLESLLVNGVIKSVFRRDRPTTVAEIVRPHILRQPRTTSFPSGHASAAAMFVVIASEDDSWWPLYVIAAGTVAKSRAYVRIHHMSDVLGGIAVGAALGVAFRLWWPSDRTLPRPFGSGPELDDDD